MVFALVDTPECRWSIYIFTIIACFADDYQSFFCFEGRFSARSREVGVGHPEDFADGGGEYRFEVLRKHRRWSRVNDIITNCSRSFLTNFTSNLATPTKPVSGKGLKGPFFSKLRSFEALITWHGWR